MLTLRRPGQRLAGFGLAWLTTSACAQLDGHSHDTEIISRVALTFTPQTGGPPVVAVFTDPDGDGGVSGTADSIALALDTTYALEIILENELTEPTEDITADVRAEAETHLLLVYGSGVDGPESNSAGALVTHAYADTESLYGSNDVGEDLPVGLRNTITTDHAGTSQLSIMLRHLPALNGQPQKTADLPSQFADGENLPGDVDVKVRFELTVQ